MDMEDGRKKRVALKIGKIKAIAVGCLSGAYYHLIHGPYAASIAPYISLLEKKWDGVSVNCNDSSEPAFHSSPCREIRQTVCKRLERMRSVKTCDELFIFLKESELDQATSSSHFILIHTGELKDSIKRAEWVNKRRKPEDSKVLPIQFTQFILSHEIAHLLDYSAEKYYIKREYFSWMDELDRLNKEDIVWARKIKENCTGSEKLESEACKKVWEPTKEFVAERQVAIASVKKVAAKLQEHEFEADVVGLYMDVCDGNSPQNAIDYWWANEEKGPFKDDTFETHPMHRRRAALLQVHYEAADEIYKNKAPCPLPEKWEALKATKFRVPVNQL